MASEAPPFWWQKADWRAALLWPFSKLYGAIAVRRMDNATPPAIDLPVMCIGNLTVGGGGKTPTSIAVAQAARKMKLKPGIISRGYGGTNKGVHLVDPQHDLAKHVGDEPLLISHYVPIVVSVNRLAGAQKLQSQGCDFIIMDDGFQSMRLKSDFNLVVIDSRRGVGNGHVIPAGPLRAPVIPQMRHASAVLKTGTGDAADFIVRQAAKAAKPIYIAKPEVAKGIHLKDKRVLAFSGIADPEKFFDTLTASGAYISLLRTWPDHHYFADDELRELYQTAEAGDLILVTTEKDAMRLERGSQAARMVLEKAIVFRIEMVFDQADAPVSMIEQTIENFKRRQISKMV
jgi:tetraacyldisaccharide 4'-kinase